MVGLGTLAERLTAVGTGRVLYRGWGNLGNPPPPPPPKASFPQPKILATILINTCRYNKNISDSCLQIYTSLKISRISLSSVEVAILIRRVRFK